MPATWAGYWLGRLLCRLGKHDVLSLVQWGYGPRGDHTTSYCVRDCQWADERWQRPAPCTLLTSGGMLCSGEAAHDGPHTFTLTARRRTR